MTPTREAMEAAERFAVEHGDVEFSRGPDMLAVQRLLDAHAAAEIRRLAERLERDSRPGCNEGAPEWLIGCAARIEKGAGE